MKLARIPQLYRNLNRSVEVVSILSKYGLANWASRLDLEFPRKLFRKREGVGLAHHKPEARIRLALTELGPTFIKLGQILSTRPDLVGNEVASELEKLQDGAPSERFEIIRETIEHDLQRPLEDVFQRFDEVPLASASIGQVHRARLTTGEEVVVKVRHHGIDKKFRVDLDILGGLAQLMERVPELQNYRPTESVEEIRRTLMHELDFRRELRNLVRFGANFAQNQHVRIPRPYEECSSECVLVMDWLDGVKLAELARSDLDLEGNSHTPGSWNNGNVSQATQQHGTHSAPNPDCRQFSEQDKDEIAKAGVEVFLEMIFRHGFYHADPHPGNILLLQNNVIGLVDCGMVGHIDEQLRESAEEMLLAIADQDAVRMTTLIHRVSEVPPAVDRAELTLEVADFMSHYANQPLDEFDFSGAVNEFTALVRRFHIKFPARLGVLLKVLVMLDGTAKLVSPKFSLGEVLAPYRRKLIWRRLSPVRKMRKLRRLLIDIERLAETLPGGLVELFEQIQTGKFDVHLDHRGLEPSVNRLVLGLLASALFLGSSVMLSLKAPPLFHQVSILGLSGCVVSLMLGVRLLWAFRKSGRLDRRD
ncbi:MAG: AarF/ABC1/UbiB kinase family protein [Pirellulales bacterium]|nr:AarF/ABC1/UbiB kinase family protein [Pirellulales bacterium]